VDIPEDMDLLERRARNLLPVCLSILNAGNSIAVVGSTHGPASFSDPNPFSRRDFVDDSTDFVDGAPECIAGVFDTAAFEVRVCIWKELVTQSPEIFDQDSTHQVQ
jgi:hypothetical protein